MDAVGLFVSSPLRLRLEPPHGRSSNTGFETRQSWMNGDFENPTRFRNFELAQNTSGRGESWKRVPRPSFATLLD
jgi:hypothetical protein